MMKLPPKSASLLFLFCLSPLSFAQAAQQASADFVTLSAPSPAIGDMACSATPVARTFTYTIQSNYEFDLNLINNQLMVNPGDTFTGAASLSGCSGTLPALTSCTLTLSLTPPLCATGTQSLSQVINRTVYVGIQFNAQPQVTANVYALVTTLGSGASFAVLGPLVQNTGGFGPAQIIGNVAGTATDVVPTQFNMILGNTYLHGDLFVSNANTDMQAAYNTFTSRKIAQGCSNHGDLTTGQVFTPGYYCLTAAAVTVGGAKPIVFSGAGQFVFFVPDAVNLTFLDNAHFSYLGLANKNNVYWVVGTGVVTLTHGNGTAATPGAVVDGTILTNGPIVAMDANPNSPAAAQRLWTNYVPTSTHPASIALQADTVSIQ